MADSKPSDDSAPSPRRYLIGCIGAIFAMVLLMVAVVWSVYAIMMSRGRKELAAEVQRIRGRGLALTTVELNQKFQARPGDFQAGAAILAALAVQQRADVAELGKPLPIVGTAPGTETPIPALAEEWEQLAAVEEYLATHQEFLNLVAEHTAKQTNVRYACDLTPGIYTQLSHVQQLRHGARVLTLQMHVDLRRGRIDDAISRLEQDVFLAQTLRDEPFLVAQLVRVAIISVALKDLEYLLANVTLTDAQLARLQTIFRQVDMRQGLATALQGELATGYTASNWPLASMMAGTPTSPLTNAEIERLAEQPASRPGDAALMLQFFRRLLEANDESLANAAEEAEAIEVELKQIVGSHRKVLYIQTSLLFPAVRSSIKAFLRTDARSTSADACLAALRYRQANGDWPESLQQLVPTYLPAIPIDPYTGKAMIVQVTDQEFKVYSLGENKTDDGGTWTDQNQADVGFVGPWRAP